MYTLPSSRMYGWAANCGIPGGIPTRSTVYASFTDADSLATISAAVNACPSGQVVEMAAGTYTGTLDIHAANPCTVRGDGAGQTVVNGYVIFNGTWLSVDVDGWPSQTAIASGYTKDSTTIVLATPPGALFIVGNLIMMAQDDDYGLVWHRTGNYAGTKNLRFLSRITNVTGNTIELATPIPHTYTAGLNPVCVAFASGNRLVGVERMTFRHTAPAQFQGADRCWLKDVELRDFANQGVLGYNSSQCEINRCYVHDAAGFPSDDGYFVLLQYGNSAWKIEDNIAYRCTMMIFNSVAASYTGYNYSYDSRRSAQSLIQPSFCSNHGPHSIMNLWEGNIGQRFTNDGYHGSGSHDVLFRNHFHGTNAVTGWTHERRLIDLVKGSYYESCIGNVIGDSSYTPTEYQAYLMAAHEQSFCYVLGWAEGGSADATTYTVPWENWPDPPTFPDAQVEATLIRHGNYDFHTEGVFEWADPDHDIADSLFYASKPAFFGNLGWPITDPTTGAVTSNPAKYRWDAYAISGVLADLFADAPTGGESYSLSIIPVSETRSKGTEASYIAIVNADPGFTNDVTLGVSGLPVGVTPAFSVNPVPPGGSSTLTIATAGIDVGTHNLALTGEVVP